jgi:hypothetical protein
VRV